MYSASINFPYLKLPTFRITYQSRPEIVARFLAHPVELGPITLIDLLTIATDLEVYSAINGADNGAFEPMLTQIANEINLCRANVGTSELFGYYTPGYELEVGVRSAKNFRPQIKLFQRIGATEKEIPLDNFSLNDIMNLPVIMHDGVFWNECEPDFKLSVAAFFETLIHGLNLIKTKLEKTHE